MPHTQQNRLNENLRVYWETLRGKRTYPEEREVEPDAIKAIWDSCFLVKNLSIQTGGKGYRYDYLGKDLIEAFGGDVTNQEITAKLVDPESPPLVHSFEKVVGSAVPVMEESEFTNTQGLLIKYRSCMLPLGNDKEGVNYILGGMKWKSF